MLMTRRSLLKSGSALAIVCAVPSAARAASFAPAPGAWRHHEITTTVEIHKGQGPAQAWIPVPAFAGEEWMRPGETRWSLKSGKAELVRDAKSGAAMVHAVWSADDLAPAIEVVSRFSGRDRSVDPAKPGAGTALTAEERKLYTAATELLQTDGIVKQTADQITAGATGDLDKARRIYEWIVDNTFRNPKTRGCGVGD